MATYDKHQKIIASNTDFDDLRKAINNLLSNENRHNDIGNQSIAKLSNAEVSTSLSELENIGKIIGANNFTQAINKIYDIVNNKYMSSGLGDNSNAFNQILSQGELTQFDKIIALSNYFTIVNFWNAGTDSNSGNCNGACSGFCKDTCYGGTAKNSSGTQYGSSAQWTCGQNCGNGCDGNAADFYGGDENCNNSCAAGCGSGCSGDCAGTNCKNGCLTGCSGCIGSCKSQCHGDCLGQCTNGCKDNCKTGCKNGCGAQCSGTCTFAASNH